MSAYKTVEGHEIIVGECYQMRSGEKMFVSRTSGFIHGLISGYSDVSKWENGGYFYRPIESSYDILRPWPTTKQEARDAD